MEQNGVEESKYERVESCVQTNSHTDRIITKHMVYLTDLSKKSYRYVNVIGKKNKGRSHHNIDSR